MLYHSPLQSQEKVRSENTTSNHNLTYASCNIGRRSWEPGTPALPQRAIAHITVEGRVKDTTSACWTGRRACKALSPYLISSCYEGYKPECGH